VDDVDDVGCWRGRVGGGVAVGLEEVGDGGARLGDVCGFEEAIRVSKWSVLVNF
jgi:hypothetical protein